jgi:hypothetical protein
VLSLILVIKTVFFSDGSWFVLFIYLFTYAALDYFRLLDLYEVRAEDHVRPSVTSYVG